MTTATDLDPRFSDWIRIATDPESVSRDPELLCRVNRDDPSTETRILMSRESANQAFRTEGIDDTDVLTLAATCWDRSTGKQVSTHRAQPLIHVAEVLGEDYATAAFGSNRVRGTTAAVWTIIVSRKDNHPHQVLACGGDMDDDEEYGDPLDWIAWTILRARLRLVLTSPYILE